MPTNDGGMVRFDINDPEDVQKLVDSGYAWRAGPKTTDRIIDMIERGLVTRRPEKEPPAITQYLDAGKSEEQVEPTVGEPVEPPVASDT
jgi:hypothetical protein